jgi:hypothetical protein
MLELLALVTAVASIPIIVVLGLFRLAGLKRRRRSTAALVDERAASDAVRRNPIQNIVRWRRAT